VRECLPSRFLILSKTSSLFGQPGSQYDFSKIDIGQLKDRARELEEQQRGMKKKVNPKVMNMIDTCVPAALSSFQMCPNVDHSFPVSRSGRRA
jgi:hypothetical protein